MSEGGKEAVRADDEVVAKAEVVALQKQIRELQRVLGKKTLENEILREVRRFTHRIDPSQTGRRAPWDLIDNAQTFRWGITLF